jgi:peptide/nickel transport system ATP-binding protein/oligopeptide transport system ATP-binding protein
MAEVTERDQTRVLEVENLVKDYPLRGYGAKRTLRAVDGVNFACDAGETVGIVGESGCGKTTLGRLIAGLVPPTSGQVTVSQSGLAPPGNRAGRPVQVVYQNPADSLDPMRRVGFSVGEAIMGIPGDERRRFVSRALESVELGPEVAHLRPHELSGGELQRVCIARALIGGPIAVILDEAVSALDVIVQRTILKLLVELQVAAGIAYVFISHDLAVVTAVSTRIIVMYLGSVMEVVPRERFEDPLLHPYSVALKSAQLRPRADGSRPKAIVLSGDPPSALERRRGCRFASRCPLADNRCRDQEPALTPWGGPGQWVACYYPGALKVTYEVTGSAI